MTGKIVNIFHDKKFGFIRADGAEYFFHRTAVRDMSFDDLRVGHYVTFDPQESLKGLRANNVTLAD